MGAPNGLETIRIAATMNHLYPSLSTHLRDRERLLVEVTWSPSDPADHHHLPVHPCSFRHSVATAWAEHRSGRRVELFGFGPDVRVEMHAALGGRVWPCGIVRVPAFDRFVYAVGTTLDADACQDLAADILDDFDPPPGSLGVRVQGDADTQVTVVSAELDPGAIELDEPAILELMQALLARFAISDLVDQLADEGGAG
jgi:hypothetical protein